jgi:hypothetical protein
MKRGNEKYLFVGKAARKRNYKKCFGDPMFRIRYDRRVPDNCIIRRSD